MTNEEAISIITQVKGIITNDNSWSDIAKKAVKEAFEIAIKALETGEVCMSGEDYNMYLEGYKDAKKDFAPKQGEWLNEKDEWYKCSNCKKCNNAPYPFCCWCGADMRENNT